MNQHNKLTEQNIDPTVMSGIEQLDIDGKPVDLNQTNIYLTDDPMLADPDVKVINKLGILARVKVVDDSLFVYAEPTWLTPSQRALLLTEQNGLPAGTKVRVYDVRSRESALTDARFKVETVEGEWKTFTVHRDNLILDRNAKNLYFCKRKTIQNGIGFETVLVPVARYEYYDALDKDKTAEAWNMFNTVYPLRKDTDVLLTHEHPNQMRGNGVYQVNRMLGLQEIINNNRALSAKYDSLVKSQATPEMN